MNRIESNDYQRKRTATSVVFSYTGKHIGRPTHELPVDDLIARRVLR